MKVNGHPLKNWAIKKPRLETWERHLSKLTILGGLDQQIGCLDVPTMAWQWQSPRNIEKIWENPWKSKENYWNIMEQKWKIGKEHINIPTHRSWKLIGSPVNGKFSSSIHSWEDPQIMACPTRRCPRGWMEYPELNEALMGHSDIYIYTYLYLKIGDIFRKACLVTGG